MSETMQGPEIGPYRVEASEAACSHCGRGQEWVVVDSEDCEVGRSHAESEAEWFATALNDAYRRAGAAALAEAFLFLRPLELLG